MITRIRVINLKRRVDKLAAFYGAIHVTEVPYSVIEVFEAHDAADYRDGFAVREAASREFPFWRKLSDVWIGRGHLGRGSLCCLWSMQSVLRLIGEGNDDLAVLTTDGCPFSRNWQDLCATVGEIGVFDIFQLRHWESEKRPRPDSFPSRLDTVPEVSKGLGGAGDGCFVLTPAGANRILEWCEERPFDSLEILLFHKSFEVVEGCVSPVVCSEWIRPHIELESVFGQPDSERSFLDNSGL